MTQSDETDNRSARVAGILRELVAAGTLSIVDYERILAALYGVDE